MNRLAVSLLMTLAATALAAPSRVLVLLAHPDDEVLMAGTLALATRAGHQVRAVYVTSGDAGKDRSGRGLAGEALGRVRERETAGSNRALGFSAPPSFLRFPDGEVFSHRDRVRARCLVEAQAFDPDLVMTLGPDGVTGHPDHQAVYLAARQVRDRLARRPGFLAVVFSEARASLFEAAWGLDPVKPAAVDRVVPVPTHLRRKRVEVLRLHRSQFAAAMVEAYRTRALAEDGVETFQGDGGLAGVPGLD